MTETLVFEAKLRDRAGKGGARQVRREGRVPAVVYGNKKSPEMISLDPRDIVREARKAGFFSKVITISVDGKTQATLVRDVQFHPVTDAPVHADFLRIDLNAAVTVSVPVVLDNEDDCVGLRHGGALNFIRHELELTCKPDAIPSRLHVDLTNLEIGHSVHADSIVLPKGVELTHAERDVTIVSISAPVAEVEEEEVVEEESEEASEEGSSDESTES